MTSGQQSLIAGGGLSPTFVVTVGAGANQGPKSADYTYYGWCPYTATFGSPDGRHYPEVAHGSVAGSPGLGGLIIVAAYSGLSGTGAGADEYKIVVTGNQTTGIANCSIGGTDVGGTPVYTYDSTRDVTRIVWARSDATSLYGSSGTKTVVVS